MGFPRRCLCGIGLLFFFALFFLSSCSETDDGTTPSPGGPRTETFPGGGGITFPEGSLPAGTSVTIEAATTPPLPPGVDPLGDAVSITLSQPPLAPAWIRLPIPDGGDPENMVVFQVEDDGTPLLLGTEIDDDELVAPTPGFGTSSLLDKKIARISDRGRLIIGLILSSIEDPAPPDIAPPFPTRISGPPRIALGDTAIYFLQPIDWALDSSWRIHPGPDGGRVVDIPERIAEAFPDEADPGINVVGVEGIRPSDITLTVDYTDSYSGTRAFAAKIIHVGEGASTAEGVLRINTAPVAFVDSPWTFYSSVFNFQPAIYRWDFGDGGANSQGSEADSNPYHYESHVYLTEGTFTLTVSAENNEGERIESSVIVVVEERDPIDVVISGPRKVFMDEITVFTGVVVLGAGITGSYDGHWWQYPGLQIPFPLTDDRRIDEDFIFTLPGTHYLSFTASLEFQGTLESDTYTQMVTVSGLAPFAVDQTLNRLTGELGDTFQAEVTYSGGIAVVNGVIEPYTLEFHWGDGDPETIEVTNPYEASSTTRLFTHFYTATGTYEVYARVIDGARNSHEREPRESIVIEESNQVEIIESFRLMHPDAACAPGTAPESTGEITFLLDAEDMEVTLLFEGAGTASHTAIGCEPYEYNEVWDVYYWGLFTDSFTWDSPDVASFWMAGVANWHETSAYSACHYFGEPGDCPNDTNPYQWDGLVWMIFYGTVDVAAGESTGVIELYNVQYEGSWGD